MRCLNTAPPITIDDLSFAFHRLHAVASAVFGKLDRTVFLSLDDKPV
jgi:hypothetical protein